MKKAVVRSSQHADYVAEEVGLDPREVRYLFEVFSSEVVRQLSLGRNVHLDNVGTIGVFEQEGLTRPVDLTTINGRRIRVPVGRVCKVSFRKARRLKEALDARTRKRRNGQVRSR